MATLPDPSTLTHCPACGGKWGAGNTCRCHAAVIREGYLKLGYVLDDRRKIVAPEEPDDLDAYIEKRMSDPEFAAAFRAAEERNRPTS